MKKTPAIYSILLLTSTLLLTLVSQPAMADDSEWFIAAKASLGEDTIDNISDGGTIGTGMLIGNDIDGQIVDDEVDDYTAGLGFAVGKRMGNWTIEGEYVYRYRTDWDIAAPTPAIQTITNVFSDVETQTLLVNLIRRGAINQNWSWEAGIGVGVALQSIDADYIERATLTNPEFRVSDNESDTEFTYNILAGVTRDLGGPWTFNLRYRYIDLGELEAGPFPTRPARVSADHMAHELQFSFEFEL